MYWSPDVRLPDNRRKLAIKARGICSIDNINILRLGPACLTHFFLGLKRLSLREIKDCVPQKQLEFLKKADHKSRRGNEANKYEGGLGMKLL